MFRFSSNWRVMLVEPRLLTDVISVTPAMCPSWRSSGAATEVAMVSGSAPGSPADTEMVGKSTWGSGDTGRSRKAITPASTSPKVRRVVATGRFMKGAEMFMMVPSLTLPRWGRVLRLLPKAGGGGEGGSFSPPPRQPVEDEVDDRRRVQGEDLAEDQAADDGDAER